MKSITNYLNAPSSIYKSFTKGAVILTNIVCILLCLVVAVAETHPVAAILLTTLIGTIVFAAKSSANDNQ